MDAGMSSDSDCNSYSGLLEFNLHANALDRDFSKFDPSDFPNLIPEVGKYFTHRWVEVRDKLTSTTNNFEFCFPRWWHKTGANFPSCPIPTASFTFWKCWILFDGRQIRNTGNFFIVCLIYYCVIYGKERIVQNLVNTSSSEFSQFYFQFLCSKF